MKITYTCELQDDHIVVQGEKRKDTLSISFQRTVRVSDSQTGEVSQLPPGFGKFPLFNISDYVEKLPVEMVARGGAFLPICQREALWMSFAASEPFAIKIYVGGINAVSGYPYNEDEETRARQRELLASGKSVQDYVVVPEQRWLYGIAVSPGEVRQFVATPYGDGYSVEAQLKGDDVYGGIQFEVTPAIRDPATAPIDWDNLAPLDPPGNMQVYVKTLTGKSIPIKTDPSECVFDVKRRIQIAEGIPPNQQYLIFRGKNLANGHKLSHYDVAPDAIIFMMLRLRGGGHDVRAMAIAAGGKIVQEIVQDVSMASEWRNQAPITFNLQLLDAACLEAVTGQAPPPTPITAEVYHRYGLPFFNLPEEPSSINGDFSSIKSLMTLEGKDEEHLDFPVEIIKNAKAVAKRAGDFSLNPIGPIASTFRHVTDLKDAIKALSLESMRKLEGDEEETESKKFKRED